MTAYSMTAPVLRRKQALPEPCNQDWSPSSKLWPCNWYSATPSPLCSCWTVSSMFLVGKGQFRALLAQILFP